MSMPCTPSAFCPAKVWHLMHPRQLPPVMCRPAAFTFAIGSANSTAGTAGSLSSAAKADAIAPTLASPKPGIFVCM